MTRVIEVTRRGRRGADGQSNLTGVTVLAADYMLTDTDSGKVFRCTAPLTLTIPSSLAAGWSIYVDADGANVTLATDTTINGAASLVITSGNSAFVYSDGTAHYARFFIASALTSLAASGVGFSPVTGNSATNVQDAIDLLTVAKETSLDLGSTSPFASKAQGINADSALPLATTALQPGNIDSATDLGGGTPSTTIAPSQSAAKAYTDAAASGATTASQPRAKAATGAGQFVLIGGGGGFAAILPAGGTWAYVALKYTSGSIDDYVAGIGAGGTTVIAAGSGSNYVWGWAWRIT